MFNSIQFKDKFFKNIFAVILFIFPFFIASCTLAEKSSIKFCLPLELLKNEVNSSDDEKKECVLKINIKDDNFTSLIEREWKLNFDSLGEDEIFYLEMIPVEKDLNINISIFVDKKIFYEASLENVKLIPGNNRLHFNLERVYEGFVKIKGAEINGTENWLPASNIFTDGRKITINPYYICEHEVTRKEFFDIMGQDPSTADVEGEKDNTPVNYENWYMAIAYCNKRSLTEGFTPCYSVSGIEDWENLNFYTIPTTSDEIWNAVTCDFNVNGYRLPTEIEWEWAARGGKIEDGTAYVGSNNIGEVAWYEENSSSKMHEIKLKKANGYGLYDMTGNAWEWCWDWYSETIDSDTSIYGPETGKNRILRGGSWYNVIQYMGLEHRNGEKTPEAQYSSYGFRLVRSAL